MSKDHTKKTILDELVPLADGILGGTNYGNYSLTMQESTGSIYFSNDFVNALNILSGDRVGFVQHPKHQQLLMIYVTDNQLGTHRVTKSKNNPYKIYCKQWILDFKKRFHFGNAGTHKLYIYPAISVVTEQNGVKEKCYLVYDKTSQRTDIDETVKQLIIENTKFLFQEILNIKIDR